MIPSPLPRPPSATTLKRKRPKSARRVSTSSVIHDSAAVYERSDSNLSSASRPTSSFSRYTPLPSISANIPTKISPAETSKDAKSAAKSSALLSRKDPSHSINDRDIRHISKQTEKMHIGKHQSEKFTKAGQNGSEKGKIAEKSTNKNSDKEACGDYDTDSYEAMFKPLKKKKDLPTEPKKGEDQLILAIKLPNGERVQRSFYPSDSLGVVMHFAEQSADLDFSGCELLCDMPKQVFKDLKLKLKDIQLQSRTILHIQIPDE